MRFSEKFPKWSIWSMVRSGPMMVTGKNCSRKVSRIRPAAFMSAYISSTDLKVDCSGCIIASVTCIRGLEV